MNDSILDTPIFEQKRTTEKLVEDSTADLDFFVFLCASVFITTLGLLLSNPIVIVGAMLVAPILYPILALGLALVTVSPQAIRRATSILAGSFIIGVLIAMLTAFFMDGGGRVMTEQMRLLTSPDLFVFFLISFAAGIVASLSWVEQNTALSLPGVAITVSLVPPLSAIGIAVAFLSYELFVGSLALFFVNLAGIVLASIIVFSLFGFYTARVWQDDKIQKKQEAQQQQPDETSAAAEGNSGVSPKNTEADNSIDTT